MPPAAEIDSDFESVTATTDSLMRVVQDQAGRLRRQLAEAVITEAAYAGAMSQIINALRLSNRQLLNELAGHLPGMGPRPPEQERR